MLCRLCVHWCSFRWTLWLCLECWYEVAFWLVCACLLCRTLPLPPVGAWFTRGRLFKSCINRLLHWIASWNTPEDAPLLIDRYILNVLVYRCLEDRTSVLELLDLKFVFKSTHHRYNERQPWSHSKNIRYTPGHY